MSDPKKTNSKKVKEKETQYSMGVIKFDYKVAGFPEVMKIAKEWSDIDGFYELMVRKVSKDNFGIQFIYVSNAKTNECHEFVESLCKQNMLYARDYEFGSTTDPNYFKEHILILKAL